MLLLLLACTDTPAPPGTAAGDALVMAVPFDPGNLSPIVAPYALSGWFSEAIEPGLVIRELGPEGLRYRAGLAESWSWSEDGRTLTYVLKPGLVWSDGAPLTSADVVFTWELIGDEKVASNWFNERAQIERIEAVDPRTVAFHFVNAGNPELLQGFTIRGIVPQHVLATVDRASLRGDPSGKAPLSSAAWLVKSWSDNEKLVLEPNPQNTAFPAPKLRRIIARVIPEYSTRLIELRNGGVDYLASVEVGDVPLLRKENPELELIRSVSEGMTYLGWNLRDPRFEDARVRRALTLAIDRDRLIEQLMSVEGEAYARPAVGSVSPTAGEWFNAAIPPLPLDREQSLRLMQEVGWTDSDKDGVLDRDGKPFVVNLLIQGGIPQSQQIAVFVQASLREIGVKLEIQSVEPNRFSSLVRQHEFEAMVWGFGTRMPVDPTINWHTTGQYNWMGYSDPATDALLEELRATRDLERAKEISREVQARVYEAQPATFLWWEDGVAALDKRFEDVHTNPFNALERVEEWWVPAEQQKWK